MRRKRKRRPRRAYSLRQKPATPPQQAKGNTTPTHPHPGVFALAESSLPQPLEDAAIGGEMSKLQTLIKNFVHSYYHSSHVTGKSQGLSALGANPSIPIATLAAMLRDPRKSAAAMRYCIAWTIFSRVGFDRRDSISLLPPRVVGCIQLISDDSKGKGKPQLRYPFDSVKAHIGTRHTLSYLRLYYLSRMACSDPLLSLGEANNVGHCLDKCRACSGCRQRSR